MRWATAVMVLLALVACGQISDTHHPPGNPHTVASGPVRDLPLAEITVEDGTVSPPPGRLEVKRGERVRLTVTCDHADEVHVHGFDVKKSLAPGKPVTLEFTADRTGVFEVEIHKPHLVLTQLAVR